MLRFLIARYASDERDPRDPIPSAALLCDEGNETDTTFQHPSQRCYTFPSLLSFTSLILVSKKAFPRIRPRCLVDQISVLSTCNPIIG
jgi:hypothetical protein